MFQSNVQPNHDMGKEPNTQWPKWKRDLFPPTSRFTESTLVAHGFGLLALAGSQEPLTYKRTQQVRDGLILVAYITSPGIGPPNHSAGYLHVVPVSGDVGVQYRKCGVVTESIARAILAGRNNLDLVEMLTGSEHYQGVPKQ